MTGGPSKPHSPLLTVMPTTNLGIQSHWMPEPLSSGRLATKTPTGTRGARRTYTHGRTAGGPSRPLSCPQTGQMSTNSVGPSRSTVTLPSSVPPWPAGRGGVYVFERVDAGWRQAAKLSVDDGDTEDGFGTTVALAGTTVFIGAPKEDTQEGHPREDEGAVYVFERATDGWDRLARLEADDQDPLDRFGSGGVALAGQTALIGTPSDDTHGAIAGSAYMFGRSTGGWTQQTKLIAPDGEREDRFGHAIALTGQTALVGAPNDANTNGDIAGAAYVFDL